MNNNDRRHPRHVRDSAYQRDGGRYPRGEGGGSRGGRQWESSSSPQPQRERTEPGMSWKRIDLHLHTPASSDYRDPGISYLDILKKAEEKKLDMIAFADHNTVAGYASLHREIDILAELERRGRLDDNERQILNEYRRLLSKIVVLPAFEFTATFGFHILGIFPENTSVRKLEYLLLDLNVPEEKMLAGAPDAGSTSDVLRAYQAISAAGGMAIAAHANSSNGVAMQGFPFGGQTKIAYTQDSNLMALEVTDFEAGGRRTTASFFNGSKTEYPRRMHLLQGSDAHSLDTEQMDSANKRLGVGARVTEILVKDASFAALKEIFTSNDFARIRPAHAASAWEDIEKARAEGPDFTRSFHERASNKTNRTRPVLHDIVAFANGEGGTIYIGASPESRVSVHGIDNADEAVRMLRADVSNSIEPGIDLDYEVRESGDRAVVLVKVPEGDATPYVYTPTGQIYVRDGGETVLATRAEIIDLVRKGPAEGAVESAASETTVPSRAPGEASVGEPRDWRRGGARPPLQPAVPAPSGREQAVRPEPARREPEEPRQTGALGRPQQQQLPALPSPQGQAQPQNQGRQESQPAVPAPRSPALSNLPPEKIKGKVQPMIPRGGLATPGADTVRLTPTDVEAVSQPEAETAAPGRERITSPLSTGQLEEYIENASAGIAPVAESDAPQPEPEVEGPADAKPAKKPARRSRKSAAAQAAETVAAETVAAETPVMEATVAAEHKSREELVAEEKPKRKRLGRSTKEMEKLEVAEPAASAAATEPGVAAIIEETHEAAEALEAREAHPAAPAKSSRSSRRKKGAAEETAAAPEQPAAVAEPASPQVEVKTPEQGGKARRSRKKASGTSEQPAESAEPGPAPEQAAAAEQPLPAPPTMGVEIVDSEVRDGTTYHTVRNLRDHQTVHNVTRRSARRLWHYAILQHEHGEPEISEVMWHPDLPVGLWRRGHRAGVERYDLVLRKPDGKLCIYYGVTDEGLEGPWREIVDEAIAANYFGPDPAE